MSDSERKKHMDWCKRRALDELDRNGAVAAAASMVSDLSKNAETAAFIRSPVGETLVMAGLMAQMQGRDAVRHWIEGFA